MNEERKSYPSKVKEFTEENFTITQDDLERILLGCTTCHEQIILEDVLTFRMKFSQVFGKLRATIYTLHNVLRMNAFVRDHQHKEN